MTLVLPWSLVRNTDLINNLIKKYGKEDGMLIFEGKISEKEYIHRKELIKKYAHLMDDSLNECTEVGVNLWDEAEALYDLWPYETIDISVKKCLYQQNDDFKINAIVKFRYTVLAARRKNIPCAARPTLLVYRPLNCAK